MATVPACATGFTYILVYIFLDGQPLVPFLVFIFLDGQPLVPFLVCIFLDGQPLVPFLVCIFMAFFLLECVFQAVLWIRTRMDPELLPGSVSGIIVPDQAKIKEQINK